MEGSCTELHHLQYFLAVARHRSFTRAAAECHVAQPSLSQQIRRLEELLRAPLFDRSAGSVRLTAVGAALLPHAQRVLAEVSAARQAVQDCLGLQGGRVVVGTLPITGSHLLPKVLVAFRAQHPGIQVLLREERTQTLIDLLRQGELDICLLSTEVLDTDLVGEPILTEDLLLAVPLEHAMAGRDVVPLAAAAAEPFILMKEGNGFRDISLTACAAAGFQPQAVFDSNNIETIQAMVAVGLGVALVPRLAALRDRSPAPVFLELAPPRPQRTLAMVWRKDRHLSPAAQALLAVTHQAWQ